MDDIQQFTTNNMGLVITLNKVFGDYTELRFRTLNLIKKNTKIFTTYLAVGLLKPENSKNIIGKYGRYHDIHHAFDNYKPGNVFIYFCQIELYGIFESVDIYRQYLESCTTDHLGINIYQLIMIEGEFKFMVTCKNNKELIDKIMADLKLEYPHLTTSITARDGQTFAAITLEEVLVKGEIAQLKLFEKIQKITTEIIYLPEVEKVNQTEFYKADISGVIQPCSEPFIPAILEDILKYLKQSPTIINIYGTVNGAVGHQANVDGGVHINAPATEQQILDWVRAHPPNKERKNEYYLKCRTDIPNIYFDNKKLATLILTVCNSKHNKYHYFELK